jgi:hypothetical protein
MRVAQVTSTQKSASFWEPKTFHLGSLNLDSQTQLLLSQRYPLTRSLLILKQLTNLLPILIFQRVESVSLWQSPISNNKITLDPTSIEVKKVQARSQQIRQLTVHFLSLQSVLIRGAKLQQKFSVKVAISRKSQDQHSTAINLETVL